MMGLEADTLSISRMLQFNQGKKTKNMLDLRQQAEKTFIQQLDMALDAVGSEKHAGDHIVNQGKSYNANFSYLLDTNTKFC